MQAELTLGNRRFRLHLVLVVETQEGHHSDAQVAAAQIIHELAGEVGSLGPAARASPIAGLCLDQLSAVDVDDVPAPGTDVVAIVDAQAVAMAGLDGRKPELLAQEKDFFLPEAVDPGASIATGASATGTTLMDRAGGKFPPVMTKGALALLE